MVREGPSGFKKKIKSVSQPWVNIFITIYW